MQILDVPPVKEIDNPETDLLQFIDEVTADMNPDGTMKGVKEGLLDFIDEVTTDIQPIAAQDRLLRASVLRAAQEDKLFHGAPTDVSKLRRLNQLNRQFELPELDELPDALKPVGIGEEFGKQFGTARGLAKKVPFAGEIALAGFDLATTLPAAERAKQGQATESDVSILADAIERTVQESRERTGPAMFASIVSEMPTFMAEFVSTGGTGPIARKAATKTATKLAGKAISDAVEKVLVKRGIKGLTNISAQVAAMTALKAPPQAVQRYLPEVRVSEGNELVVFDGETPLRALKNAGFDMIVEIVTEHTGRPIAALGRFVSKPVREAVRKALHIPKLKLNTRQFFDRIGYQGVVPEMSEEALGKFVRQQATDAGLVELPQPKTTLKELGAQAAAFAIPGVARGIAGRRGGAPVNPDTVRRLGSVFAKEQPESAAKLVKIADSLKSGIPGKDDFAAAGFGDLTRSERKSVMEGITSAEVVAVPTEETARPKVQEQVAEEKKAPPKPEPMAKKPEKGEPRKGIGKARKKMLAIHEERIDVIDAQVGVESPIDDETGLGREAKLLPAYSFNDTPTGRSDARQVRELLPTNLRNKVTVKKGVTSGVSASDLLSEVDHAAMAQAVIDQNRSRDKDAIADRTSAYILDNPQLFTPEQVLDAKSYKSIASGNPTESVSLDDLDVGDSLDIDGESHVVTEKEDGAIELQDDLTLSVDDKMTVAADKGTVQKGEGDTSFEFGESVTPTNLIGEKEKKDKGASGKQATLSPEIDETIAANKVEAKQRARDKIEGQGNFLAGDGKPTERIAELSRRTPKSEKGENISDKAQEAREEAGKAWDDLSEYAEGRLFSTPIPGVPLDPKLYKLLANAVLKSVRAGVLSFADFVAHMKVAIGEEKTKKLGPAMVQVWNEHRFADTVGMDKAEDIETPLTLAQRKFPYAQVPGITTLPDIIPGSSATVGSLMDQWFGDRDVAIARANTVARNHQDEIIRLSDDRTPGTKHKFFGKTAKALDRAIFLYIDLKGKAAAQFEKYGAKMSDAQKADYERANNLSADELKLANQIREEMQEHGRKLTRDGLLGSWLENYMPRLWDFGKVKKKGLIARFMTKSGRQKARTLESALEGFAEGFTLRVQGGTNAQLTAVTEMAKVRYDRNLIEMGARAGLISDQKHEDWVKINHPNFRKWVWIGKVERGKVYGSQVFISKAGDVFQRVELYAPKELARQLNNVLDQSALFDVPGIPTATKWNAIFKHTILTTSFFHHQAFIRSTMLAGKSVRLGNVYQAGQDAITNFTQEYEDLTRAGMTTGRVQDWEEDYLHERTVIGRVIDRVSPAAGRVKDKLLELRDRQTNYLFKRVGANLKVGTAILEYLDLIKKHDAELKTGKITRHQLAKIAANIANDDFGGLHLGRMGRNPTLQHIFRMLALAPDWTESNVRSMVKAFKKGGAHERAAYQAMWARVLLKGMGATLLLGFMLAGFDFEEFWKRLQRQWKEGHLRWLDIDITPIYHALGGDKEKRKFFSLIGHFRDPIKFIVDHGRSAKHKGSVLTTTVLEYITGTDWAGRPFTTAAELVGIDDKGLYLSRVRGKHEKGDLKGGRFKGQLVRNSPFGSSAVNFDTLPSFLLNRARSVMPIPIQQGVAWLTGAADGFDAMTKSVGLMTSTTYPPKSAEKSIVEAMGNENKTEGRAAFERMVRENSTGPITGSPAQERAGYIGKLVYSATNKKNPNEQSVELLDFLDIGIRDANVSFDRYWRGRGFEAGTDAHRRRKRSLRRVYLLNRRRK